METYFTGKQDISIRAYYDTGNTGTYYREMYLADLATWLDAHSYTHPGTISYTIKIDVPQRRE